MKQKKWFLIILVFVLSLSLAACSNNTNTATNKSSDEPSQNNSQNNSQDNSKEVVNLKFMFWGSNLEKQAVVNMTEQFNESHPHIQVEAQHVTGDFTTKINVLMATDELPDMSYLDSGLALKWAQEGKVMDMTPYLDIYPELRNRVPQSYLTYAPGKIAGSSIAADVSSIFYNVDIFNEAGIELPPVEAEKAWTWDEFLNVAQRLTIDGNGNNALDPAFDPSNIKQYGVSSPEFSWFEFLASNETGITNEDGTEYTMDSPEAIEVFQNLKDLMYKYHVAPNAVQQENMPATSVSLETGRVAMAINGQWILLDVSQSGINYGIGVLPKFKVPKTNFHAAATVMYSSTKHPEEAMEFYLYYNNPEKVDLYSIGLWQPIELKYFTEPEEIAKWADNDVHPAGYKESSIDYLVENSIKNPALTFKNWVEINPAIRQALDLIWTNEKPVKEVLEELGEVVQPLLQGKYPEFEGN